MKCSIRFPGNTVVLLTTSFSMIQKIQKMQYVRVTVDRRDVVDTEAGELPKDVPLGFNSDK